MSTNDGLVIEIEGIMPGTRDNGWYEMTAEGKLLAIDRDMVMQKLIILISERDGGVLEHGIEVGKQRSHNDGTE